MKVYLIQTRERIIFMTDIILVSISIAFIHLIISLIFKNKISTKNEILILIISAFIIGFIKKLFF